MGIPAGSELHVAVEDGVPLESFDNVTTAGTEAGAGAEGANKTPSGAWRPEWVRSTEGSITLSGAMYEVDGYNWLAATAPLPATGTHSFAISFGDRLCCISVGFVDSGTVSLPFRAYRDKNKFPGLAALFCIGDKDHATDPDPDGAGDAPAAVIEFHYNPDKHTAIMVPKGKSQNGRLARKLSNLPPSPIFVVAAHKHKLEAKFVPLPAARKTRARA